MQSQTEAPSPTLGVQPIWKDPLIWFVLGLYFISTAIMNFLPVTFPIFRRVFGSTLEQLGRIQVCYYGSAVVFTIGGGWFVGRLGYRRAIVVALAVIAASLVIVGSAQSYTIVLVGAFCFGLGVLSISVTTASIIGEHFGAHAAGLERALLEDRMEKLGNGLGLQVLREVVRIKLHGASILP